MFLKKNKFEKLFQPLNRYKLSAKRIIANAVHRMGDWGISPRSRMVSSAQVRTSSLAPPVLPSPTPRVSEQERRQQQGDT